MFHQEAALRVRIAKLEECLVILLGMTQNGKEHFSDSDLEVWWKKAKQLLADSY